jgi:hypothetical protein
VQLARDALRRWGVRACDVLEVIEVDGGHANLRRRQRGEIRATAAAT